MSNRISTKRSNEQKRSNQNYRLVKYNNWNKREKMSNKFK